MPKRDLRMGPRGECAICEQKKGPMRYKKDLSIVCFTCYMMEGASKFEQGKADAYFNKVTTKGPDKPYLATEDWEGFEKKYGITWPKNKNIELKTLDGGRANSQLAENGQHELMI